MHQALQDLWFGFGVAFEGHNLMWSFFGVLVGNLIGVLPGMGALSAISILLPLTYVMKPVPAILMLAGIFYGSMYGGAIGAILLNLPSHPPHAVTCLDGYPMTKKGKGGTALGITMIATQRLQPSMMDAAQQKMMTWFMPILFTGMMLFYPAGLTLYIFTNNILSIVQQFAIRRIIQKRGGGGSAVPAKA